MSLPKFTFHRGQAVLTRSILSSPSQISQRLEEQATLKSRLLIFYKQFYKLRNLIDDGSEISRNKYHKLLRRHFTHISFETRRQAVIGSEITTKLTESDLIKRLENTLVFVFNSTVKSTNESDEQETNFFEDIKRNNTDTNEKKIVSTILEMEYQKPDDLKYDFNYKWIGELNIELDRYDKFIEESKTGRGFKYNIPLHYIGFKQYETTLMRLNEHHKLCL